MADTTIEELLKKHKHLADSVRLQVLGVNGWNTKASVLTSVKDALDTPPPDASVSQFDRFLVLGVGQGDWAGRDNLIVNAQKPGWSNDVPPTTGDIVLASETSSLYTWDGAVWLLFSDSQGAPISSDIPQPLSFDAESAGVLAETSRSDHAHRLIDPAVDPSNVAADAPSARGVNPTAARSDHQHEVFIGSQTPEAGGSIGSVGGATSLARSDHRHGHGQIPGGNFHTEATTSLPGFMSTAHFDKVDALATPATGRYTPASDHSGLTGNDDVPLAIFVADDVDPGLGLTYLNATQLRATATQRYEINVQVHLFRTSGQGLQTLIMAGKVLDAAAVTNIRKREWIAPYDTAFAGSSYNARFVLTLQQNETLTITVGNMSSSDIFTMFANTSWVDIKKI